MLGMKFHCCVKQLRVPKLKIKKINFNIRTTLKDGNYEARSYNQLQPIQPWWLRGKCKTMFTQVFISSPGGLNPAWDRDLYK